MHILVWNENLIASARSAVFVCCPFAGQAGEKKKKGKKTSITEKKQTESI